MKSNLGVGNLAIAGCFRANMWARSNNKEAVPGIADQLHALGRADKIL
jgi:hypothetical protein